jgi:tetratricopeptide (TPR) repeat protein
MAPEQHRNEPIDARTDQFSFCVALYEAVYGHHPFSGGTLGELTDAVCEGRVRPEPPGTLVPSWIRELLLRGLASNPAERWPSMNALLAELGKQPALATRRRFVMAAVSKLTGIWEAPGRTQQVDTLAKAEIRQAFLATGKPYAARTWQSVSDILDRYTQRWSDLYVEACEATHVRGEQSAEVLDLRIACLEEARADLAVLVRLFRAPTADVVEHAVSAANALSTLERCENVELLRALLRPPADAPTRDAVERLRARLAEVRALSSVGRLREAQTIVGPVEHEARALGYAPFLAEVLLAVSRLAGEQGGVAEAASVAEEALFVAITCRHDEVAAEAATMLVAYAYEQWPDVAWRWSRLAEALLSRIGGHERLWSWLYSHRGLVQKRRGALEEGLENEQRALATKAEALGSDHPDVGISLGNIAVYLDELGRLSDAIEYVRRAKRVMERALGPDHPGTAIPLANLAEILGRAEQWEEAVAHGARALAIFERESREDGSHVLFACVVLGAAYLGAGRFEEALIALERAEGIAEKHAPAPAVGAQLRFALARALRASGREPARADALARAARQEYAGMPATAALTRELTIIEAWLAAPAVAG